MVSEMPVTFCEGKGAYDLDGDRVCDEEDNCLLCV